MKTTATNRKLRVLLKSIETGALIPRPDFQRRLVWSNKDKCAFIETVLMGYPFPEVYIAAGDIDTDTAEGVELLVDGQQRITTLYEYWKASEDLKLQRGMPAFADLTQEERLTFLEYEVVLRDLGSLSIADIKEVFKRINSTKYALNAMEINHARYDGEFKRYAELLSKKEFFEEHKVFKPNDVRRMHDLRYMVVLVSTLLSTYFSRDSSVADFLEKFNDEFPDKGELDRDLENVFQFIEACKLGENSKAWRQVDLFTLIVEVHRAMCKENQNLSPTRVGKRLKKFYSKIAENSQDDIESWDQSHRDYVNAFSVNPNERGQRTVRGKVIRELLITDSGG